MLRGRWLPALQHASSLHAQCCLSEDFWAATCALLDECFTGLLHAGWLSSPSPQRDELLPADEATREAACSAHEGMVLLCVESFRRSGHALLLRALLSLTCAGESAEGTHPTIAATAAARAVGSTGISRGLVDALGVAVAALQAMAEGAIDDELLHPAMQLSMVLLRLRPEAICVGDAALHTLWQLALLPFADGFAAPSDAECRSAGLGLLRQMLELAGTAVGAKGSWRTEGNAPSAAVRAAVAESVRPRLAALVEGLVGAVAHLAAGSDIEPAAELLLTVAVNFSDEWQAAFKRSLLVLDAELQKLGRKLPPRAHELLVAACVDKPKMPSRPAFVAMCLDLAQVVRAGLNANALERYSR